MTTLAQANRAIAKAGIPLELERGEGYHYFIYDVPARGLYETVSIYVPYTKTYSAAEWANQAGLVYCDLLDRAAEWAADMTDNFKLTIKREGRGCYRATALGRTFDIESYYGRWRVVERIGANLQGRLVWDDFDRFREAKAAIRDTFTQPYTKPDGTEMLIVRAPRRVAAFYLSSRGYRFDAKTQVWSNGKDPDLAWGVTIYGHYIYVA